MTSSIYAIKNKNYFPRTILHILLSTLQLKVKTYKLMITKRNFVSNYWGSNDAVITSGRSFLYYWFDHFNIRYCFNYFISFGHFSILLFFSMVYPDVWIFIWDLGLCRWRFDVYFYLDN